MPPRRATTASLTLGRPNPGQGLRNLRERLSAIGGRCLVTSEPGRGTQVALEVDFT